MKRNRKRNRRAREIGNHRVERALKAAERRAEVSGLATFGRVSLRVLKRMQALSRANGVKDD